MQICPATSACFATESHKQWDSNSLRSVMVEENMSRWSLFCPVLQIESKMVIMATQTINTSYVFFNTSCFEKPVQTIFQYGAGSDHFNLRHMSEKKYLSNNFSLFIEFLGVILVNKIIQVSGTQFCNTSSVYCIVSNSLGNKALCALRIEKGTAILEWYLQSCQSVSVKQWEISLGKRKIPERFKDPIEIHTVNCHSPQRLPKLRRWMNTSLSNRPVLTGLAPLFIFQQPLLSSARPAGPRGLGRSRRRVFSGPCELLAGLQAKMFLQSDSLCD